MMFINYKMYDTNAQLLGVTGTGFQISYIDDVFKRFRQNYMFSVYFIDKSGKVVLSETNQSSAESLDNDPALKVHKETILSKKQSILEFNRDGNDYLIHSKYIPELNLHILVEAKIDDFMKTEYNTVLTYFFFQLHYVHKLLKYFPLL